MENLPRENDTHAPRTPEEEVFYDYLMRMKPSSGQRFLRFLIEDAGYDAMEAFWSKLRDTRYQDKPDIELDDAEQKALARALHEYPRRDFLLRMTGMAAALGAARLARSGMEDVSEGTRWGRYMRGDEKALAGVKFGGAVVLATASFKLLAMDVAPSERTIAGIAAGEDGEKRVAALVRGLDHAFAHVECLMDEAGSRRSL